MSRQTIQAADGQRPLYAQIEQVLRDAIMSGEQPVGQLLPPETELCAQFKVSRYTVREALRRLSDTGLVARRQGAGTIVISNQPPRVFVQSARSVDELFQYAVDTHLVVTGAKVVEISGEEAGLAGAPEHSRWLRVDGVRQDELGQPICTVTVFVAERYAGVADDLATLKGSIFAHIEQRWGIQIADVLQEISAGQLAAGIARVLGAKRDTIGMRFRRRYSDSKGDTVLTSINWHPADRFVYATHLKRNAD